MQKSESSKRHQTILMPVLLPGSIVSVGAASQFISTYEQPPLFGKERNSLWMETFFFQIHRAYGNEVGGNPKTR